MATYHTEHKFTPGMESQIWDRATHRKVWRPNPNFCAVCGRKEIHILHPESQVVVPSRFSDPAYIKAERSVARSERSIRRAVIL